MNETKRYSDQELELFRIHIEQMIEKEKTNLQFIINQIKELGENNGNDGDWMDDSSLTTDKEMLYTMEGRQRRHLWDLENALIRVKSKIYGICIVTGEKIDKRRLMAVPTTTRSLAAKGGNSAPPEKANRAEELSSASAKRKEILSRVAANVVAVPAAKKDSVINDDEDDDQEDDNYEDDLEDGIDLDELAATDEEDDDGGDDDTED